MTQDAGQDATLREQSFLQQSPVSILEFPPQNIRFRGELGRQYGHHAIVHVCQHLLPQGRRQGLDEAGRVRRRLGIVTVLVRR